MEPEAINQALFHLLNAPEGLSGARLVLAIAAAKYSGLALLAIVVLSWVRGQPSERVCLVSIVFAAVLALGINYVLGLSFPHPRPFMIGIGHTYVAHAPETSFPSDHATLMWTFALGLLLWTSPWWSGWLAVILAALTSWARVFLGLHFPFDMLGSVAVAATTLAIFAPLRPWITRSLMSLAARLH